MSIMFLSNYAVYFCDTKSTIPLGRRTAAWKIKREETKKKITSLERGNWRGDERGFASSPLCAAQRSG